MFFWVKNTQRFRIRRPFFPKINFHAQKIDFLSKIPKRIIFTTKIAMFWANKSVFDNEITGIRSKLVFSYYLRA